MFWGFYVYDLLGAPTNIYIQGLDSVSQLSNEVRVLKEENQALQSQLQQASRGAVHIARSSYSTYIWLMINTSWTPQKSTSLILRLLLNFLDHFISTNKEACFTSNSIFPLCLSAASAFQWRYIWPVDVLLFFWRWQEAGRAVTGCRLIRAHQAEAGGAGCGEVGGAVQAAASADARANTGGSAAEAGQTDQSGEC